MKRRQKWILAGLFAGLAVLALVFANEHVSRKIERSRAEFLAAERARIDAQERARERCTFRADADDSERRVVLDKARQGNPPQICSCDDAGCCVCY